MFMTRRPGIPMAAWPRELLLKICPTHGYVPSAAQAKIYSRVSELLPYPGKDSSKVKWYPGGQ